MEREKLLKILAELSRRFFHVCRDVAQIARSVRVKIAASNVQITEEKLREQLSRQCRIFEKLDEIQEEVAAQFGVTLADVQAMQKEAAWDQQVQLYSEGFRCMLNDSLSGSFPVLPGIKIPPALTEEKVLEIQAEAHALETQKVLATMGANKCTMKELGKVLDVAHRGAWEETLDSHADLVNGGQEVYYSAVALYMRNEDFRKERKKLEDLHQKRMVKLFRMSPGQGEGAGEEQKEPEQEAAA